MTRDPRELLAAKIAGQTDDMLCTIAVQLYRQTDEVRTADVALVARMVADELCKRYPAADALMEEWFGDESPAGLDFITRHTYGELVALAATMARESLPIGAPVTAPPAASNEPTLTHTVREFSVKETAAEMRKALRAAFPGVKFSVTMSRGTAYGWIDVNYTDGPVEGDVRGICAGFESSRFDGMDDSYHAVESTLYALEDGTLYEPRYSCRGVSTSRRYSPEAEAWAEFIAVPGSYWWPNGVDAWRDNVYYSGTRRAHLAAR